MAQKEFCVNFAKEYKRLEDLKAICEKTLAETGSCVPLHVHFDKRRSQRYVKVFTYELLPDGVMKEKYLKKKKLSSCRHSIERYCSEHTLRKVRKALYDLKTHPETYIGDDYQRLFADFELAFGRLVPAAFHSNRFLYDDWANHYNRCAYREEELIYRTKRGEYVRSKFELMVADTLWEMQIPYRYECRLSLGNRPYLPDFMLRSPISGDLYLLEAFGMMDSPEYAANALQKLKDYQSCGYHLGKNLLAVFDSIAAPFETGLFMEMLRQTMDLD